MKILHVVTSLAIGGVPRLLESILPLQVDRNEITVLVYVRLNNDIESRLEQAGIRIISLNEPKFRNPRVIFRMRKIFQDYDIVHSHLFPTLYWASLASRGLNVKMVYTEHSTSNSRRGRWYFRPLERFIYKRYDKIISISQQTHDALTLWLEQDDARFVVVNNGVDTKKLASVKMPIIPKSLIMVSRFAASKDQETVIRAMKYIDKDATISFVGDGENLEACKKLAAETGVSDRVRFLGSCSDVPELISSSYIGIQSSKWEGFGLAAVEVMACGKPIIATDVDGLKQIVIGAGEVFTTGNVLELAGLVNNLLADERCYNDMAERCKKRALEYDISLTSSDYLKLYDSL